MLGVGNDRTEQNNAENVFLWARPVCDLFNAEISKGLAFDEVFKELKWLPTEMRLQ